MRGGKRLGAGRKKGFSAMEAEAARGYIALRVSESLEPIVSSLINQAKRGSIPAARELFDRAGFVVPRDQHTNNTLVIQIPEVLARKNGLPIPGEVKAIGLPTGTR